MNTNWFVILQKREDLDNDNLYFDQVFVPIVKFWVWSDFGETFVFYWTF